jgi:BMFP domain-containing protein YqiC
MKKTIEDLKKEAKEKGEARQAYVHNQMKKRFNHYRAWDQLDGQFNKWLENPKLNEEQSAIIRKCRMNALLLRAEVETRLPEVVQFDFDFWDGVLKRKEEETKNLKRTLLTMRKENEALKEATTKMEATIKAQKAEIDYHEKQ